MYEWLGKLYICMYKLFLKLGVFFFLFLVCLFIFVFIVIVIVRICEGNESIIFIFLF